AVTPTTLRIFRRNSRAERVEARPPRLLPPPARVRVPRRRPLRSRAARPPTAAGDSRTRANAHKVTRPRTGGTMQDTMQTTRWTGWIGFAGCLMIIIGGLDFFQGLIAIVRGAYYHVTPDQIIVFDTTTWGWITLLWGIIVALAGF